MQANNNFINQQIDECVALLKIVLGEDLLGVYLYGSIVMGGLQKYSDIDLFVVSNRQTTLDEKIELINALLKISGIYAVSKDLKPIELTIVVKSDVNPWKYPPKFDFLYGDWMRKDFKAGIVEPWKSKELPNLALVITQLLLSHKILFGIAPDQVLVGVPYKDFISASTQEIDSLMNDLQTDTRNVLLTLARIWCTLDTDTIRSKADATSWAIKKLPSEYKPVLERAMSILLGDQEENWNDIKDLVEPCARFIIENIKKRMSIYNPNDPERVIAIS